MLGQHFTDHVDPPALSIPPFEDELLERQMPCEYLPSEASLDSDI